MDPDCGNPAGHRALDMAFACAGTCRGCVDRPWQCGDTGCPKHRQPLVTVPVIYACSERGCSLEAQFPALCTGPGCNRKGQPLEAFGVVPPGFDMTPPQFILDRLPASRVLNPPEDRRQYSSVWNNDAIGTGHARSTVDSEQAWSAGKNDGNQWVLIDAGSTVVVEGVLAAGRARSCKNQIVTRLRADVSDDGAAWRTVDGGRTFATGVQPMEEGAAWIIEFDNAVSARYVRLSVDGWESHISLRCGLLTRSGDGQAEEATVLPNLAPVRRAVVDCGVLPAKVTATHIPGGAPAVRPAGWVPGDVGLDCAITGRHSWSGRQMEWNVLDLNGSTARTAVVRPSQACSIEVAWRAWWRYDSSAYCPGCIVQLYFGMSDDKNNNVQA